MHGRVMGREADGPWVRGQVREAERSEFADERTEHTASARWLADRSLLLDSEAVRHESLEPRAVMCDDAQRCVPRTGQLGGQLD